MRIEQIQHVLEVYKTGSLNKAAKNLFIVQSTLSTSIRSLEKNLGQAIFIRTQNGMEVTDFGREFIRIGKEILDAYDQIQLLATQKRCTEIKKTFCISVYYLDFAIREFINLYSENKILSAENLEFLYYECSRSKVIEHVSKGTSEIGVLMMPDIMKSQWLEFIVSNKLEYYLLSVEAPKILVSDSHPLAKKEEDTISFRELEPYDMLWYEEDGELFRTIHKIILDQYHINNQIRVSGRGSLKEMMHKTDGYIIGCFNENAYKYHKYDQNVRVFCLKEEEIFQYEIGFVKKIGEPLSELSEKYIQALVETLSDNKPMK